MKTLGTWFGLGVTCAGLGSILVAGSACSARPSSSTADAGGTGGGAGGGGLGGSGGSAGHPDAGAEDPDIDEGPPWDGTFAQAPQLLASDISAGWVVAREHFVYLSHPDPQLYMLPVTGGTATPALSLDDVGGVDVKILNVGSALLFFTPTAVHAWRPGASPKLLAAMIGVEGALYDAVELMPSASQDRVLVSLRNDTTSTRHHYWLDTQALTASELPTSATSKGATCAAAGESVACAERLAGDQLSLWKASDQGLVQYGQLAGKYADVAVAGDTMLVAASPSGAFRIDLSGQGPPETIATGDAGWVEVFQDDWVAWLLASALVVTRPDGSQLRIVSESAAPATNTLTTVGNLRRNRWVPFCDVIEGKWKTLRLHDPKSGETKQLAEDCQLRGLTYSDRYALVLDDYVETPNDPLLSGYGKPTVVDIETGERKLLNTESPFPPTAQPLGKSQWIVSWLSYANYRNGGFYDAYTTPETSLVKFQPPIASFLGVQALEQPAGLVVHAQISSATTDRNVYWLPK